MHIKFNKKFGSLVKNSTRLDLKSTTGLSITEVLVVTLIFTTMVGGVFTLMTSGQAAWYTTDTQIELQENIRRIIERVSKEMRETGTNSVGTIQLAIDQGIGVGNSDILRFAMPVICEGGESVIDANGDVANWGAPLTWGCQTTCDMDNPTDPTDGCTVTCMDNDNDCSTVEYSQIEYLLNGQNQLVRRVLDGSSIVVPSSTIVFANGITDFQASLSVDEDVVTLTITSADTSSLNRTLSLTESVNVFLRNST